MLQGSVNKVDASNAASGLYTFNSKGNSFLHNILNFISSGIGAAAIPARLRLRKNFGERSFSPVAVLLSVSFYIFIFSRWVYLFDDSIYDPSKIAEYQAKQQELFWQSVATAFVLLVPIHSFSFFIINTIKKAYTHFKDVYSHSEKKINKYSYYRGDSILNDNLSKIGKKIYGYTVDEKIIRIYYEPKGFALKYLYRALLSIAILIVMIFTGMISSNIGSSIRYGFQYYEMTDGIVPAILAIAGFWLISYVLTCICLSFSGFCLLIEELIIAKKIRDTVLDMIDGEHDMQFILSEKAKIEGNNDDINLRNQSSNLVAPFIETTALASMHFGDEIEKGLSSTNEPLIDVPIIDEQEKKNNSPKNFISDKKSKLLEQKKDSSSENDFVVQVLGYIILSVIVFGFLYNPISYIFYGVLPFKDYSVDINAVETPTNSEIKLKTIEGGINSTKLTFEITNNSLDTLSLPFTDPNDTRSPKIYARKSFYYMLNKYIGTSFSDTIEVLHLKKNQTFNGSIIVPPMSSESYTLNFERYGISTIRKFSILSEDKALNKSFIRFNEIDF